MVCLLGARQTGKSTLAAHLEPARRYISLDDTNFLRAAQSDPAGFIGQLPANVTLDEIQKVPEPFTSAQNKFCWFYYVLCG